MPDPEIVEIRKNLKLFIESKIDGQELARRTPLEKQENILFKEEHGQQNKAQTRRP